MTLDEEQHLLALVKDSERQLNERSIILRHEEKRLTEEAQSIKPRMERQRQQVEKLTVVQGLLQATIDATTTANLRKTEEMVNTALQSIFPEKQDLRFFFTTETKRGISTIIPHLTRGNVDGLTDSHGGGLIAPISLVLRVITNIFANNLPLIMIDESLVHISAEYQLATAQFLETITRELGITVLLVTHQPMFAEKADKIIKLSQNDMRSTYIVS